MNEIAQIKAQSKTLVEIAEEARSKFEESYNKEDFLWLEPRVKKTLHQMKVPKGWRFYITYENRAVTAVHFTWVGIKTVGGERAKVEVWITKFADSEEEDYIVNDSITTDPEMVEGLRSAMKSVKKRMGWYEN